VQLVQVQQEIRARCRRHLDADQHAAVIRAVIAIMEQADVPVRSDRLQELQQGARPFGKFEAVQVLVLKPGEDPPTICRTCSLAISLSVM